MGLFVKVGTTPELEVLEAGKLVGGGWTADRYFQSE
jgi:hypothetical protein